MLCLYETFCFDDDEPLTSSGVLGLNIFLLGGAFLISGKLKPLFFHGRLSPLTF
jgi:hypothetical protein